MEQRKYTVDIDAKIPQSGVYGLEIVKEGTIQETFALNDKDHFLIGRNADICEIPLDHASISRQHCVLQYTTTYSWFLIDLNSTHGCFVNKKKILKGGRVLINVGDVMKFGESSRLYILTGPSDEMPKEYDSENLQKLRKKIELRKTIKPIVQSENTDEELKLVEHEISWGFMEDAPDDEEEGAEVDDSKASQLILNNMPEYLLKESKKDKEKALQISKDEVNKKDMKTFEKMVKKQEKIDNITTEIERIRNKESEQDGGLTAGQMAQIERNEAALQKLTLEIKILESQIEEKNAQRLSSSGGAFLKGEDDDYNSEEDDFYDKTKQAERKRKAKLEKSKYMASSKSTFVASKKSGQISKEIDTYETLVMKKENLNSKRERLKKELELLEQGILFSITSSSQDSLEAFMHATELSRKKQSIKDINVKIKEFDLEEARLNKLIHIAKPSIIDINIENLEKLGADIKQNAPKEKKEERIDLTTNEKNETISKIERKMPLPVPEFSKTNSSNLITTNTSIKRAIPDDGFAIPLPPSKKINNTQTSSPKISLSSFSEDDPDSTWVPPITQKGDGIIALNNKFLGRY